MPRLATRRRVYRAPERTPDRTADQHTSEVPVTPEASPDGVNTTDQTPSTEPTADSRNKSGDASVTVVAVDDERDRECIICLEEILVSISTRAQLKSSWSSADDIGTRRFARTLPRQSLLGRHVSRRLHCRECLYATRG